MSGDKLHAEKSMKKIRSPMRSVLALSSILLSAPSLALDAGSQLRRFQDETQRRMENLRPKASQLPESPVSAAQAAASASTERTSIDGFEVHGVTQFSEAELAAVLETYVGRSLNTADIHAAANDLMRHYRKAGYMLAKVFIPPQRFTRVIRLDVFEGHLEPNGIEVVNKGKLVRPDVVQSILERHLYADQPLKRQDLERALLLADDLPGARVGGIIYPGMEVGSARLRTVMRDEPQIAGNIDFDNFNNRQLGQERLGTTLYLNSPSGVGDQVVTRLVTSGERSNYAYLTYLRPVGSAGTRIGFSLDYFNYDADMLRSQGEVNGHASDARLYVTYPLIRSRYTNLSLRTDLSHYRILDQSRINPAPVPPAINPFARSERRLNMLQITLSGDQSHDFLPNGTTLFEASGVVGNLNIVGDANFLAYDRAGPNSDGDFARFSYRLQRLQHIAGPWSLYGSLHGQVASKRLDSSQRFYLGGATSQAGYPYGETNGDTGFETHLELRHDFIPPWGGNLQAGLFYTMGKGKNHGESWQSSLQSSGLQLTQTLENKWVLRGLVGWQIGESSSVDKLTGSNADGRDAAYRVWIQAIRYFGLGD